MRGFGSVYGFRGGLIFSCGFLCIWKYFYDKAKYFYERRISPSCSYMKDKQFVAKYFRLGGIFYDSIIEVNVCNTSFILPL